jgi:hypothetical protein
MQRKRREQTVIEQLGLPRTEGGVPEEPEDLEDSDNPQNGNDRQEQV